MKFSVRRLWVLGVLCALACASAHAATLQGKVTNATTGRPAASVEVILLQLQGGMQPVANTKSDSQGQFTFDNPAIGAQPMRCCAQSGDVPPKGSDDTAPVCLSRSSAAAAHPRG